MAGNDDALSRLESQLLVHCLDGDHPVLAGLRAQVPHIRVTERLLTGDGFITSLVVGADADAVASVADREHILIEDVYGELFDLEGPGFAHLFLSAGYLSCLEYFSAAGGWPEEAIWKRLAYFSPPTPEQGMVVVVPMDERDMDHLRKKLE